MVQDRSTYVHVTPLEPHTRIPTGPATAIPGLFTAEIDDPQQPFVLHLKVRTVTGRKPAVVELVVEPRSQGHASGITTESLRRVHIAKALKAAVERAIEPVRAEDELTTPDPTDISGTASSTPIVALPARGIPVTSGFLERVAEVYRSAVASGSRSPVVEVGRQLGGSRSTAGRWVVQARKANILRPAIGTRAGEATRKRPTTGARHK